MMSMDVKVKITNVMMLALIWFPVELGIVRSIDTLKGLLYVITPVPQGTLEKVDLLLQGFIQLPTSLLQVIETIKISTSF